MDEELQLMLSRPWNQLDRCLQENRGIFLDGEWKNVALYKRDEKVKRGSQF